MTLRGKVSLGLTTSEKEFLPSKLDLKDSCVKEIHLLRPGSLLKQEGKSLSVGDY